MLRNRPRKELDKRIRAAQRVLADMAKSLQTAQHLLSESRQLLKDTKPDNPPRNGKKD
jgi:hypothetical protein